MIMTGRASAAGAGFETPLLRLTLLLLVCANPSSSTADFRILASKSMTAGGDVHSQQFLEFLAERLSCPSVDTATTPSCVQENRKWLTQCLQEAEHFRRSDSYSEMASIWMVDLMSRFGAQCGRHETCRRPPCKGMSNGQWTTIDDVLDFFQPSRILDNIQRVLPLSNCQKYIDDRVLQAEVRSQSQNRQSWAEQKVITPPKQDAVNEIGQLKFKIAEHLLQGDCVASSEPFKRPLWLEDGGNGTTNRYLDDLFSKYTDSNDSEVSEMGVQRLLEDVHLASEGTLNDTSVSAVDTMVAQPVVVEQRLRTDKSHRRSRRTISRSHLLIRSKRSVDDDNDITRCLKSEELISYYDVNKSGGLDKEEFLQMLAYIVFQISSGTQCKEDDHPDKDPSMAQVYGYATLCVFIISACSTLGFLVIPLLPDSIYQTMMVGFIALAFGTLTGDAIMHMLPESLLGEDTNGPIAPPSFWKTLAITLSIYVLFVFEVSANLILSKHSEGEEDDHEHGHSHVQSLETIKKQIQKSKDVEGALTMIDQQNHTSSRSHLELDDNDSEENVREMIIAKDQVPVFLGLTSLALVIIVGDMIHNVTDGISIGASFAESISEGFSTSLAVFFHELPHEFGDFVILLTTGQTMKRALFWNFVSSLTAFIGVYVGIAIGVNEEANQWIFAITAGMFLYVAIADMLPELRNMKTKKPWVAFLAANIGTLFGMGFMVFMYFLEDLIQF